MAKRKVRKPSKKTKSKKLGKPFSLTPSFWKKHWIPALIIFALGLGLYLMALNYEYVLDDQIVITKNDFTKKGFGGIWDILSYESFAGYFGEQKDLVAGARYRPLSIVTFAVERGIFGEPNRQVSHFLNALIYALTCLLLFRVLEFLFPYRSSKSVFWQIPFWAALIYTLHPVHVEVVANIKGRDEIMTMLGSLGTLYLAFRYAARQHWKWLAWMLPVFFLAIMSKENAITFLAVIPIALYYFPKMPIRKILIVMLPLLAAAAIYMAIRHEVIGYFFSSGKPINDLMNDPFLNMSPDEESATILYTLAKYIRLLFFPHPLSHDYYPYAIPIMNWGKPLVLLSAAFHLLLAAVAVLGIRKRSVLSFCILYYIATLSVVSNIFFPVGTFMNERFLFMPSMAFAIFLPYLFLKMMPELTGKRWPNNIRLGLAILILYSIGFTVRTVTRIPVWKNPLTLNSAAVKVSTNSARANCFMATALFTVYREQAETEEEKLALLEQAEGYLRHSLSIYPTYGNSLKMLGGVFAERYRFHRNTTRLLNEFTEVLRVRPTLKYVMEYLDYLERTGRVNEELIDFYYSFGYEYLALEAQNFNLAVRYVDRGLRLNPDDPRLNYAMSKIYEMAGDPNKATIYRQKAGSFRPE